MSSEFELQQSFNIDDGQLDDMSPQNCFVLGYELAMVDENLKQNKAFQQMFHSSNKDRIEQSCKNANVLYRMIFLHNDQSEMWMMLTVTSNNKSNQEKI